MTLTAHPPIGRTGPDPLTREGVHVLLVYGARIKMSREGQPGIRVTAGYHDGSVLLEAVGFNTRGPAQIALAEAVKACEDAGLLTTVVPHRMSSFPARIIRRRPE